MNKADLAHLLKLAQLADPLPKGTKATHESRFYAKARALIPGMVETLSAQERAIANLNKRVAELEARHKTPDASAGLPSDAHTKET